MDITGCLLTQVENGDVPTTAEAVGGCGGQNRPSPPIALSSILSAVEVDQTLSPAKRSDLRSALKAVADYQLCRLGDIPATAQSVEAIIFAMRSDPRGRTKLRISNIASSIRSAITRYGTLATGRPKRSHASHLSLAWQTLIALLPNSFGKMGLIRFSRWATDRGLEPISIDQVHFDRFEIEGLQGVKHPVLLLRNLVTTWNRAADNVQGWPNSRLAEKAKPTKTYRVASGDMAPELRDELEAYFDTRVRNNGRILLPTEDKQLPGLRASSAAKGRRLIAQYLGALRAAGDEVSGIQSLQDLTSKERATKALTHMLDRRGGKAASQLSNMAGTLAAIARHALGDAKLAEELSELRAKVVPEYRGMVDRNRQRLTTVEDPMIRRTLLRLPFVLMERAYRGCGRRAALDAQLAVAIELLIHTALRIGNIAILNLDTNLRSLPDGKFRRVAIVLDPTEVKNREERYVVLQDDTILLFEAYLETFRPQLCHGSNRHLFPGSTDGPKDRNTLSQQISKVIKDNVGIGWHPHLFRALAAVLHLEKHSGDHMGAMRILGDRSLKTFIHHYAFIDTAKAHKALQETITASRGRVRPRLRTAIRRGEGAR